MSNVSHIDTTNHKKSIKKVSLCGILVESQAAIFNRLFEWYTAHVQETTSASQLATFDDL